MRGRGVCWEFGLNHGTPSLVGPTRFFPATTLTKPILDIDGRYKSGWGNSQMIWVTKPFMEKVWLLRSGIY